MGGASSIVNHVPIATAVLIPESLSHSEKVDAGQKLLVSGTLEDVIVLFRHNQLHSFAFTNYVLSGKWVNLVNLDEVKGIYDKDFVFELDPARSEYHFANGAGYLLKNYIARHNHHSNYAINKHCVEKWESSQLNESSKELEKTESAETLFTNPNSPSTIAPNELPEQFLPLLLVRILSVYLKQVGKSILAGADSKIVVVKSVGAHPVVRPSFDFNLCWDLQQEQYMYFHALQLQASDILGITLTTGWIAKIRRVVDQVNLPLCICQVRNTASSSGDNNLPNFRHPIVYANDAYCQMHATPLKEVLNDHSGSFFHHQRTESEHISMVQNALRNGTALKVAISSLTRSGDPLANMLALRPIYNTDGKYTYMVSVHYNLYEQCGKKSNISADLNRIECLLSLVEETMTL